MECKFSRQPDGTLVCLTHQKPLEQVTFTRAASGREVVSSTIFCPVSLRVLATTGLPSRVTDAPRPQS